MNDVFAQPTPQNETDAEGLFRQLLADMSHVEEQMYRAQADSLRLTAETQAIKAGIDSKLVRLEEQVRSLSRVS